MAISSNREEMIVQNMPLVTFVVNKMADEAGASPIDREDAIAYGTEGLIQAVDNFDPMRGTTFASFAIRRIRGSILDAIRRMDVLPRSLRKSTRELDRANIELATMLGRWPTLKELSLKVAMPIDQVRSIMGHSGTRVVSLEKMMDPSSDGEESSRPWEVADPDQFPDPALALDRKAAMQLLGSALNSLSSRDKEIVQMRYFKSMPFHEIGKKMNLSESRVCQLHKRILSGLNKRLKKDMGAAA
jgi:RNA polymerase sigma factor for flagellar operon FliA